MRYRMETKADRLDGLTDKPTDEEKDAHREKGWEFVTELGRYFFIYSAEEGTPDYFDDPMEESRLYQTYANKRFSSAEPFLYAVLTLMIAAMIIIELMEWTHKSAYWMVHDIDIPFSSLPVLLFPLFTGQRYKGMQRLQKSLSEGDSHPQDGDWMDGRLRRRHKLHYIGYIGLIVAIFLPLLPFTFGFTDKPIEELKHPLPMVALAEIENDPDFYYVDRYYQREDGPKEEWWERESNRAYSTPTIGAPIDISFNQAGRIDGKQDANGEPYESVLWIDYKKLSSFVSPMEYLEEDLRIFRRSDDTYTVLTDTPFDYAVLVEKEGFSALHIISGQKLLELTYYYGDADLKEHYDLYEKVLQQEYQR